MGVKRNTFSAQRYSLHVSNVVYDTLCITDFRRPILSTAYNLP